MIARPTTPRHEEEKKGGKRKEIKAHKREKEKYGKNSEEEINQGGDK